MTTTTLERTEGLSVLNQAMAVIKEKIEEKRGVFNVQMEVCPLNIVNANGIVIWEISVAHFITVCMLSAQSGHRHRWDRATATAGTFGEGECWGGRRRWRWGNGGQSWRLTTSQCVKGFMEVKLWQQQADPHDGGDTEIFRVWTVFVS